MGARHSSTGWPQKALELFELEAMLALCYNLLLLQNVINAPRKEWGEKNWKEKKKKEKTMSLFSRFLLVYVSLPESKLEKTQ